ncbi:MAG: hypothetical protein GY754_41610 [bacterium]|nr:hypothetical protein [bacterium]
MGISKRDYEYKVVKSDSLTRIAKKHGMEPTEVWARRIWQDSKNQKLHTDADMYGKKVKRQLHLGENKYRAYDHDNDWKQASRAFEDPHQIILYAGEKIWISKPERELHELTDDELMNGYVPEQGKKLDLIIPSMEFEIELNEKEYSEDDIYTLYGYKKNNKTTFIYKKTLSAKEDLIEEDEQFPRLKFIGTPRGLLYSLELQLGEAITDENGDEIDKYFIFEDRTF